MYSIYVVFKSFPGKREEFVKRIREEGILQKIREEDGCHRYDYFFSEEDADKLLLIEEWETAKHQQIHIEQSHMVQLRQIKEDYIESTKFGEIDIK